MLVWLNGPFGVGKTTTAEAICDRTSWRLFDPEFVGYMLQANLRDLEFDDFQDLAPWRFLVPAVALEIHRHTGANLIAVQTVLVEEYWSELRSGLVDAGLAVTHVLLDCETAVLRERIEQDEIESEAKEWRLDHIAQFEQAREQWLGESADIIVDSTTLTPEQAAMLVIGA